MLLKRKIKKRKPVCLIGGLVLASLVLLIVTGFCNEQLTGKIKYQICELMLQEYAPALTYGMKTGEYQTTDADYRTQTESTLNYDKILAENQRKKEENESAGEKVQQTTAKHNTNQNTKKKTVKKQVNISREKLNDFDYLIQNFYTVDKTTTINSKQLNAKKLLAEDCSIKKTKKKQPQILIYHTHSQEGYKGSKEGDASTSVLAVGDRLTEILEKQYGYQVLHHKGKYDVGNRDHAYNIAAPYIEKILKKNPQIEVIIDLHRDAVGENSHLVTTQDGKKMAQIMFFNGLSKNTSTGEINYLRNPYIQDNLAFSLQLQIAAKELYPGFTRNIYLKSYRYNMHFCPKSTLIEVGAQNNTLQEALNAMEPLAAVLDQVLSGK